MCVLDERSESHCYDVRAEFCLVFTRVWVTNKRKATALKFSHFSTSDNSWIHCTLPLRLIFLPTKGVARVGELGGVLFDAGKCDVSPLLCILKGLSNNLVVLFPKAHVAQVIAYSKPYTTGLFPSLTSTVIYHSFGSAISWCQLNSVSHSWP